MQKIIINLFDVSMSQSVGSGQYAGGNTVTTSGYTGSQAGLNGTYVVNGYTNTLETTGNDFSPEKAIFYERTFMKNYTGKLVHSQFGDKLIMPKHSGGVVNIRGMSPYPVATTPLQEGVTPKGNLMNFYYIEIAVNQYGAYTPVTDWASFASRDDILVHDAEELSSQAARTIETIDAAALNAGLSVIYAPKFVNNVETAVSSRSGLDATALFSVDMIFRGVNYLENQDAEPIGESFVAIVHPNVKYDIMRDDDFISVVKYAHADRIFNGEIGTIGNVRFVSSTNAKVFKGAGAATSNEDNAPHYDVYSTLILAKDAYKIVEIEGEGMKTIVKALGSGGTSDPLDQRATQGWKTTHGIGITGETRMVRIESTSKLSTPRYKNEKLIALSRANTANGTSYNTANNNWDGSEKY